MPKMCQKMWGLRPRNPLIRILECISWRSGYISHGNCMKYNVVIEKNLGVSPGFIQIPSGINTILDSKFHEYSVTFFSGASPPNLR